MKTNNTNTMIYCFIKEAHNEGYTPSRKDIADFERLCREVVAVRAGGAEKVPFYLKSRGMNLAMADYSTADPLYYRELVEMYQDRAKKYISKVRLKDTCSIYDYDGDLEEVKEVERDIQWEIEQEYAELTEEETYVYTWQDFYDSADDITLDSDYLAYYHDRL